MPNSFKYTSHVWCLRFSYQHKLIFGKADRKHEYLNSKVRYSLSQMALNGQASSWRKFPSRTQRNLGIKSAPPPRHPGIKKSCGWLIFDIDISLSVFSLSALSFHLQVNIKSSSVPGKQ